jgi:hypothetical protein
VRTSLLLRASSLVAAPVLSLASQQPSPSVAPSGRRVVACAGQLIEQLTIYTEAPSVASLRRVPVVARVARTLHETTQPNLVERFLLFKAGDRCEELRRAESERILRAQPFIADADVFIVTNEDGTVDAEIRTIDETAVVFGGSVRARSPNISGILFGNANLGGQGVYASGSWRTGDGFRDGYSGRLIDHQFLGKALVAGAEGVRNPVGGSWRMYAGRPFFTDLQRVAWRARIGESSGLMELRRQDGTRPDVELRRRYFELGAIGRVGVPGRLGLFGVSLTGDDEDPGTRLVAAESGMIVDLGPLPRPFSPHHLARVNVLLGARDIRFVRRRALDAITASQDVPLGVQIGLQAGRSTPMLGAEEKDFFLAGDLYVGLSRSERATTRLQLRSEGRRAVGQAVWDGVLVTGRLLHQIKISPANVDELVLDWAAGYRQRMPFQLLLGVHEGGVRGYEKSNFAGGQRIVARYEHRYNYGAVRSLGDVAFAGFIDAGRQWAGDVLYGVSTPVKGSLGLSLLASVPSRSTRVWRADVAFPVSSGSRASWTIRFTNIDRTAFAFRDARDVAAGRELTVPSSIFAWP